MSKFTAKTAYSILFALEMELQNAKSDFVGIEMDEQDLANRQASFIRLLRDRGEIELADLMSDEELMWEQS